MNPDELLHQPVDNSTIDVLLVEDNFDIRRLLTKTLANAGYQVHQAPTLAEARQLLSLNNYRILLCDIQMGDRRSTTLLQEQQDHFKDVNTLVIAMSAESMYRDKCEELGADFFLEKPIAPKELVTLFNRLTQRQILSR